MSVCVETRPLAEWQPIRTRPETGGGVCVTLYCIKVNDSQTQLQYIVINAYCTVVRPRMIVNNIVAKIHTVC